MAVEQASCRMATFDPSSSVVCRVLKYNLPQEHVPAGAGPLAAPLTIVVAFSLLALLAPVAAADAAERGEFVVGFRALPDEARAGRYQGEAVARVDEALGFAVVHAADARGFQERAARDPNVRYVQREAYAETAATPDDPYYAQQYGWARVNAPAAWDVTRGDAGIVVAVIDTGVDRAHPDLAGSRLLAGYDFLAGDADPSDDCGHGTGVTGVVAATTGNALGVAGGAQVSVMPLKALGMQSTGSCGGPFSAVASSIRYAADQGARVVSMSLGCKGCYDQATSDAIEYAYAKGVLLVGSAGNAGPCSDCVSWPAAHPRVIAVACTDAYDAQCSFSSAGAQVDVAAPGKNVFTTARGGGYGPMSGTSLSAPHVSAALALALSANGALGADALRAMLASTAKDLGAAGADPVFGAGLLDMGALVAAAKGAAPAPANAAPTASFAAVASDLVASVDASASADAEGPIAEYAWSWGDGAISSGAGPTASHAYAAAGSYTITLTVKDAAGAAATTSRAITVSAPPPAPAVHVAAIDGIAKAAGKSVRYAWNVAIVDAAGAPVAGASVTATVGGKTLASTTASTGVAAFRLDGAKGQTWTLCVAAVQLAGYARDAAADAATCRTISG